MKYKSIFTIAVVFAVLSIAVVGTASANSIYLIADHHSAAFDAWNINPSGTATYQSTYNLQWATDPAGVAVDESSNTLFVTSEFSLAGIEFVDATTMTSKGKSDTGVTNMAGIEVDDATSIVYSLKRGGNTLYAYDWNPTALTLSLRSGYPVTLSGCSGGYGIALDETAGILWVADGWGKKVRAYNVGTWTEDASKSFTPTAHGTKGPIDVAVDRVRGIVYTVSMSYGAGGPGGSNYLSKWEGSTETSVNLGHQGVGVAVDEATGYVYVTGDKYTKKLEAWDTSIWTQVDVDSTSGSPAGICIHQTGGFNPLGLAKDDGLNGACVNAGGTITYTMSYTNGNPTPVTGVIITDTVPSEVTVTDTGGGTQSGNTVTWNIGALTAGQSGSKTLTVQVNAGTAGGTVIDNAATINGNEQNTGPTTVHMLTTVCTNGAIPTVESSDAAGNIKDTFQLAESVYAIGSGYSASTTYNLYILNDQTWSGGESLAGAVVTTTVTTGASGNIPVATLIWASAVAGNYDIVVDVDGNGQYDASTDALDDMDVNDAGFEAIPEFPTVALPVAAILGLMFLFQRRKD